MRCRYPQIKGLLPNLQTESEIKEAFSRIDYDGDGRIDLTDFLMWEERMEDGKANTDFWALQEVPESFRLLLRVQNLELGVRRCKHHAVLHREACSLCAFPSARRSTWSR